MSEDLHSLSGAYVLDALTEQERSDFEMHLRRCPTCREEVDSLREVAPLLAETVAVPPPASLRASILAQAAQTRQDAPDIVHRTSTQSAPPQPPSTTGEVVPLRRADARPRRRWLVSLAAAAALVVGGGVTWQVVDQQSTSMMEQVAAAPDARTWQAETTQGATVSITRSEEMGKAVIRLKGMKDPGEGRAYQAWLQDAEGNLVPAGVMSTHEGEMVLEGDVRDAMGVGVTVEPAGGSEQPTSDPVAMIVLS